MNIYVDVLIQEGMRLDDWIQKEGGCFPCMYLVLDIYFKRVKKCLKYKKKISFFRC